MRTGNSLASNDLMKSIPLRPAIAASQVEVAVLPSGVTAPIPVTATRLTTAEAYVATPASLSDKAASLSQLASIVAAISRSSAMISRAAAAVCSSPARSATRASSS